MTLQPQLAKVVDALDHAQRRLDKLAESVPEKRWNARAEPSRWSVAECVAHLNLTSEAYIPRLQRALDQARSLPPAGGRRYRRSLIGWVMAVMVGPLPSIGKRRIGRVKTMPAFVPKGDLPKHTLLAEFARMQRILTEITREAEGLPIDKVRINSPFGERVRYDCYSALVMIPRHQERHLQQAEMS